MPENMPSVSLNITHGFHIKMHLWHTKQISKQLKTLFHVQQLFKGNMFAFSTASHEGIIHSYIDQTGCSLYGVGRIGYQI